MTGTAGARPAKRAGKTRTSRADEVQQQIKQLILDRGLAAGDPMPTEFELVDELDISRNSLREALKALQAVGIVEIKHGHGMYVGSMSMAALVDELTFHARMSLPRGQAELAHLVDIREVLERGLIEQVIDRAPDGDDAEVEQVLIRMAAEAAAGSVTPETDRRFHELLYRPLANPIVEQLLSAFWDVYHTFEHELVPMRESSQDVVQRHREIYEALRRLDRPAAHAAMTEHFHGIRERLTLSTVNQDIDPAAAAK